MAEPDAIPVPRCRRLLPALLLAALAAGGAYTLLRWHTQTAWRVVASEDFAGPGHAERWLEPPSDGGMFTLADGRLVSKAERDAFLILRQRLSVPVAIEYTGEILPGAQPCDLSVQWSEADGVAEQPARFAAVGRSYMIQAGAFGNAFCAIYRNPGRVLLAHADRQLESGRRYRFRVELDGARLALAIDGVTVAEAVDDIPTRSGFISLYGFYPGKAFDDVRVLCRAPAPPSALDAGDAAFLEQRFASAAGLYARVVEAGGDPRELAQAWYRKGLAEWNLGQAERAAASWQRVDDAQLADRIACLRLDTLFNTAQRTPHASWLEERWRDQPGQREQLKRDWREIVQRQLDAPARNTVALDYLLGLRGRLFPDDPSCRYVAAAALHSLRRYEEVLTAFPEQRNPCARAMLALGRSRELVALPWVGHDERVHALGMLGDYEQVLASPGLMPMWRVRSLIRLDRAEEALRLGGYEHPALLHLGRAHELLDGTPRKPAVVTDALLALGRLAEAAGDGLPQVPGSGGSVTAMLMLGQLELAERLGGQPRTAIRFMRAAEQGDDPAYAELHDRLVPPADLGGSFGWFAPMVMRPFVDVLHGDAQALERELRPRLALLDGTFARSAWFVARALLGDAPVEEVAQMSNRYDAPAWQLVAAGMRAELQGDRAAAQRAYAAFTALPLHRRLLNQHQPDADLEWFIAWRLRELAKAK